MLGLSHTRENAERNMENMRKQRFDNSQTGGLVVTASIFMHLERAFQINMKKFCTEFWAQFWMCVLLLKCDLYSNKYGKYD